MKSSHRSLLFLAQEKQLPISFSFMGKFSALLVLLALFLLLPLTLFSVKQQRDLLYLEKVKAAKVILEQLAVHAAVPLLGEDTLSLNLLVKEARHLDGFLYAMIVDSKKIVRAHTDPTQIGVLPQELEDIEEPEPENHFTSFIHTLPSGMRVLDLGIPIHLMNKVVGSAYLALSPEVINQEIQKETLPSVTRILFYTLLVLGIMIGVTFLFHERLSRSIFHLMGGSECQLKEDHDPLPDGGKSYPLEINRNHITVLFAGIKGFRAYANVKGPEEVLKDLNEYLTIATKSILDYGGYLDKFVGDAVIGIFRHSPLQPDHTVRAVRSAIAMQMAMENASQNGNQLFSKVGIGISSGVVLSGQIGSQEKREYTFIGESFKAAYTLNVMAGPGEIVISKEVYQSVAGMFSAEPLPPREMIQRTGPWENFRLQRIGERKESG